MRVQSDINMLPRIALAFTAGVLFIAGTLAFVSPSRAADDVDPFYGIISQRAMHEKDFDTMEWGRLGSFRMPVEWGGIQSEEDGEMNWNRIDGLVTATAERGIDFLPTMYATPQWLAGDRRRIPVWNKDVISQWKALLRAAVARYGTDGQFWVENPQVPYRPVLKWQIWNEPNIWSFAFPVSPRRYGKLVKVSAGAIRSVDPHAKIVLGGFYSKPRRKVGIKAGDFLDRLYRIKGFRSSFDIAAIHPYASTTKDSLSRTLPLRRSLNRHHDRRKHMMITELGWGSDATTTFGKGNPEAQADQLKSAYRKFLDNRRRLKLDSIYWFSWSDMRDGADVCAFCEKTGLLDYYGDPKPAWFRLLDFTHGI